MSISPYPRYRLYPNLANNADVYELLRAGVKVVSIGADRANLLRALCSWQDQRWTQVAREAAEQQAEASRAEMESSITGKPVCQECWDQE
ncbi:hypothetical protein [Nocardiopsis synnemataformans]|uniref:hypothetical protein n=1 Tax=Nocardiopsis synnemataformans TaxID=61305 RepID=UPI003EBDE44C